MTRYLALLRGVNVGGNNKLPMQQLRQVFESQGFTDVSSYIQSGNVLFSCDGPVSSLELRAAVAERFDMDVEVIVRTSTQLRRIVAGNPFPMIDPRLLHVGFMLMAPEPTIVELLDSEQFAPEATVFRDTEIYFHLPNGIGRAKLPTYVIRRLGVPTTIRNWNTTTKLLELASS